MDLLPATYFLTQEKNVHNKVPFFIEKEHMILHLASLTKIRQIRKLNIENVAYSINHYLKEYEKEKIVFADQSESFAADFLIAVNNIITTLINEYNYNIDKFIIVTGALPVKENIIKYKELCEINNWHRCAIRFINSFETMVKQHIDYSYIDDAKKSHLFLFLNGKMRLDRIYFLLNLEKNNLLDKCLYSLFANKDELKNFTSIQKFWIKIKHLIPLIDQIEAPKYLTLVPNNGNYPAPFLKKDADIFKSTYISLISETVFFKYLNAKNNDIYHPHLDGIFLTEKTYRAIAYRHPFIMASRPHTLTALKDMGYKTFEPYIDESYDSIEDDYERLNCILELVTTLCQKDDTFWIKFYKDTRHIVDHNFQMLRSSEHTILNS